MGNVRLIFDSPELYTDPDNYYIQGSSPTILKEFIEYLKRNENEISEINASLYLYNNPVLHSFLKNLSEKGVKINIISIPLEGYDINYPKKIIDLYNSNICFQDNAVTKYQVANILYSDFMKTKNLNFKLYIFPHMYIRSQKVRKFSRGNMPYSLHIKSFYIKFKNKSNATVLTSSNLAVRDKIKDEVMIICEGINEFNNSSQNFFDTLINNSIDINAFDPNEQYNHYPIIKNNNFPTINQKINRNSYTGPFFNNSQIIFDTFLKDLIRNSKNRIYICGQHISAYKYNTYSNNRSIYHEGFLNELLQESKKNVEIKILSQTFVDEKGNSHGKRSPVNTYSFKEFIKNYTITVNHSYAANDSVHCKFIIVDDIAVITSSNFTPTQFIYLDNVNINKFDNIPNTSYSGIHSEVGEYIVIRNKVVCDTLINFFNHIWYRKSTYHHSNNPSDFK